MTPHDPQGRRRGHRRPGPRRSPAVATDGGGAAPAADRQRPAASSGGETVTIGIKFDQPGLGLKEPRRRPTGFDVEVAKYVAKELGFAEDEIKFERDHVRRARGR